MPEIGQAPEVVPVPPISSGEASERKSALEEAYALHHSATSKLDSALKLLVEAAVLVDRLGRVSKSRPSNRAVRLGRRIGHDVLQASVQRAIGLVRVSVGTKRKADVAREDLEALVLDPELLR